jgi:signal transduction histidine kinase
MTRNVAFSWFSGAFSPCSPGRSTTEQDHTGVLVAVRDSGPGIDPAHLDRIFKSFYTTKPNGTGIGLSICRSIIDAHGGRLWAEANEPRGTIFQFTLPAVQVGS